VGQVFGLGTKYSKALGATCLDESGEDHPIVMGCYGIGVTRTMAAIVEQFHDDAGIRWPVAVAPYHCVLVPVGAGAAGAAALETAATLATRLDAAGIEVVLDDRDERPGVKFNDADLIGFPVRVTLGRSLASGEVEVRWRQTGEVRLIRLEDTVRVVQEMLA
jgi:prolyl-tRNA synthetase